MEIFQHLHKCLVEYLEVLWTCDWSIRITTESRKQKECFWNRQVEYSLSSEKINVKFKYKVKKVYFVKMSDDKDDLKRIKVYKFDNTKESWHEFALKFRVIADSRGYEEFVDGTNSPPDQKENLDILEGDNADKKKAKMEKLVARMANKMGYRDLVMSTEVISLNIVEKGLGKTQEEVESQT